MTQQGKAQSRESRDRPRTGGAALIPAKGGRKA